MAAYVSVAWTTGDVITETKLDNMVSNDRSENAHETGVELLNASKVQGKDSGGTLRDLIHMSAGDVVTIGKNNEAGHTTINAGTSKLVKIKTTRKDKAADSYQADTVFQHGWGTIVGSGTPQLTASITFPVAFSAAPVVFCSFAGNRVTTDATVIGDINAQVASGTAVVVYSDSITTSGFRVTFNRSDAANFSATAYYGYTWLALGTI